MGLLRPSSRYASIDDSISPSPKHPKRIASNRYTTNIPDKTNSRAIVKVPSFQVAAAEKTKNGEFGFGSMVKKFMEKRSAGSKAGRGGLLVPTDPIAGGAKAPSGISGLHRKLFQQGGSSERTPKKALTEVKSNTRTLAMVLRGERELMNQNKQYEEELSALTLMLEDKNREVEKLKDLCLKQREEIKVLKDAVLFPDVMNSRLQQMLESQGSELKQAKQVIPELQKQVSDLTAQLHCLAEGLAEEYSSGDPITVALDSSDDMFLNDFNPCLTPRFGKTRKEFDEVFDCGIISKDAPQWNKDVLSPNMPYSARIEMLSKSSERYQRPIFAASSQNVHKSDESKW